jgi:UDP-galactopyranose mutase
MIVDFGATDVAAEREQDASRPATVPDVLVFSHLRWDFVYQRPQHILTRCARLRRVFVFEEPVADEGPPRLDVSKREPGNIWVVVPRLPAELTEPAAERAQRALLERLVREQALDRHIAWYYSPMALGFSRWLDSAAVVYDCMDELSGFLGAPPALHEREAELFRRADVVFTGGYSLYEAKRRLHPRVYAFPSSIDVAHFGSARRAQPEPADQAGLAHPRIGYFGVIDERIDLELLAAVADARPDWQIVMIGPIVKIDPGRVPRRANIHYLGQKPYRELPRYISGWDVAIMPFAHNAATAFISPTKTPEYLAAGRPVVSTSIRDVVRPYGRDGLVAIADHPREFVAAIEHELGRRSRAAWLAQVDAFLAGNSWDATWARMRELIEAACRTARAREGRRCSTT